MFNKTAKSDLDQALDNAHEWLKSETPGTDNYAAILDQITKLHAMKTTESSEGVSWNTWATIGGNLAGIALILGHERAHVVASKALGFVLKLK